jgi:hypothetical protein
MAFEIPRPIVTSIKKLVIIQQTLMQNRDKETNSDKKKKTMDDVLYSTSNLFEYILFYIDKIFPSNVTWSNATEKFYVIVYNKAIELNLTIRKDYISNEYNKVQFDKLKKTLYKVISKLEDAIEIQNIFEKPGYEKQFEIYKSIMREHSNFTFQSDLDTESDDDNDSSSDFDLNSIEDKNRVNHDAVLDENLSLFVEKSDDETLNNTYKRTFTRTSTKMNREIMNAYKKKRRTNNKKKIEVFIPTCSVDLSDTISELSFESENDSSSEFELNSIEDNAVDESANETINKRKFTRTSSKLNREIMNAYKKRRTNKKNKKPEKKTTNTNTPIWIQKFDNEYWGIPPLQKSKLPIYFGSEPVNENNLSSYFHEKLNWEWEEEDVADYDNYKVWYFNIYDKSNTYAYILLDKRLRDWYVLCNTSSKKIHKSYSKLALKHFIDGSLVYKSSNVADVVSIALLALS